MKLFSTALIVSFALVGSSFAGGIQGRVVDVNGNGRGNVTVSVSGHRQKTTTDSNGNYLIKLPASADGTRVNVYVAGKLAVNSLVPVGDQNSTVNVEIIRK